MKIKYAVSAAVVCCALVQYAQAELEGIPDGPPKLVEIDDQLSVVEKPKATESIPQTDVRKKAKLSDYQTEEIRRRGYGIRDVRVKYKGLPEYQLKTEMGDRVGEREYSDIDNQDTVPKWQIISW